MRTAFLCGATAVRGRLPPNASVGHPVAPGEGEISRAFELVARQHVDALVIGADGLTKLHQLGGPQ
jgi:hypothetical protein